MKRIAMLMMAAGLTMAFLPVPPALAVEKAEAVKREQIAQQKRRFAKLGGGEVALKLAKNERDTARIKRRIAELRKEMVLFREPSLAGQVEARLAEVSHIVTPYM